MADSEGSGGRRRREEEIRDAIDEWLNKSYPVYTGPKDENQYNGREMAYQALAQNNFRQNQEEEAPAPPSDNSWEQIVTPVPTPEQEPEQEQTPQPEPAPVIDTGRLGANLNIDIPTTAETQSPAESVVPTATPTVTEPQTTSQPRRRGEERAEQTMIAPVTQPVTTPSHENTQPVTRPSRHSKTTSSVSEQNEQAPTPSSTYQEWMNYLAQQEAAQQAGNTQNSQFAPQQDVSVLGNGYVQPVTPMPQGPQTSGYFSGANQPGARGTSDSELKQAAALAAMNANTYYQDPAVLDAVAQLRQNALDQINQLVTPMPQGPQTSGYFSGANQPGARGVPDNGILFGGNGSTLPAPQVVDRNAPDYQPPSYGVFSEVVSDIINAGNSSRAADDWVNSHIPENATWDTIDQIRDNLYTQYYDGIENGTIAEGTPVTPKDVTDWINNNLVVDENTQQLYDQYEAATKVADNAGLEPGSPEYYNYVNNYLDREGTPGNQRYVPQTGSTTGSTTGGTTSGTTPTTTQPATGNQTGGTPAPQNPAPQTPAPSSTPQTTAPSTTPSSTAAPQTTGSQGGNTSPYDNPNRYNPDSSAYYNRKFDDIMLADIFKKDPETENPKTVSGEAARKLLATPVTIDPAFADLIASDFAYSSRTPLTQQVELTDDQYRDMILDFGKTNPAIAEMVENGQLSFADMVNLYFKDVVAPGTGASSSSGKGSGSGVPADYLTLPASYGQESGKVVKAPYRKGGYSEAELKAMGNSPYTTNRGYTGYEGYYYNVYDKKWYPVDQNKANYYNRYGTYNGYTQDKADYYNTFGTYYGYKPSWKATGRSTGGGGGGGRGGGYGGSRSSSSGVSYQTPTTTPRRAQSSTNGYYYGNNYNYQQPVTPNAVKQQEQRINNIMKSWTF